jgi:hypothetical protein
MGLVRGSLTLLVCLCSGTALAHEPFVHPGALHTAQSLDFVKARISAGRSPWSAAFREVERAALPAPAPVEYINSLDMDDVRASERSAINAYANALAWRLTGEETYGRQAIQNLNGWADFKGFTGGSDQDKLHAGWVGCLLGEAAEIMRVHPEWSPQQIAALQTMFRTAFYPQLEVASRWNGNVDLTQIDALMNIAVFCEDERLLRLGLERLRRRSPAYFHLASDGPKAKAIEGDGGDVPAFWSRPASWPDGLSQESCRDNGHHAQFALASALHAAEVAWQQGIDVYAEQRDRSVAAMELLARQLLERSMLGCCGADRDATTGDLYDTFAVGYHHYHHRLGLDLPHTERLLREEIRRRGQSDWNIFFETFTHGR